jgi:Transposase IS4
MCDSLESKHHHVYKDNLYHSVKFANGMRTHEKELLVAGVIRKSGKGFPESCIQQEAKNKTELRAVRGTTIGAVLKGDDGCPDILAVSVYDSKPVNFVSTIHKEIKWVVNEKDVYSLESGTTESNKFLRLNVNKDYNFKMNAVDRADQLRNQFVLIHL